MFKKFHMLYRTYGLQYIISRSFHKILSLFGIQWEFSYALTQNINIAEIDEYLNKYALDKTYIGGLEFKDFSMSDDFNSNTTKLKLLKERFEQSETFSSYGVKDFNNLAYSAWIANEYWELDYGICGKMKDYALLLDDFCSPSYRHQGIHSYMIRYRLREIYRMNISKALVFVHRRNYPALHTQQKAGFKIRKVCLCINLWGIRKIFTFNH